MKFKMIQFAILMALAISVAFMAQVPNGSGGEPSTHQPSIWINGESGGLETPPGGSSNDLIDSERDPRNRSFTKFICGTNGAHYINHRAWCFRGGKMSDPSGHTENPNSSNHTATYKQAIYTIILNTTASASDTGASASLDPSIYDPEALSIKTSDDPLIFQGQGKITLDSPKLKYHVHENYGCTEYTTNEYYWKPADESRIKIVVHRTNVTEKRTGSIGLSAGGSYSGAEANFTHNWEWGRGWSFWNTNGRGFGMEASIGGWWTSECNPNIKLQTKTATVYGSVDDASHEEFTASYYYEKSECPYDYDGNPQIEIQHVWELGSAY